MIGDFMTVVWKELKELPQQSGGSRGGPWSVLIMVGMIGIFLPLQLGVKFLQGPMLGFIGMLPVSIIMAVIADSFAGERERHTLETLLASPLSDQAILFGKIGAAVLGGWGLTMVCLVLSIITVNIKTGNMPPVFPSGPATAAVVLVSLLFGLLMASAGVLVSLRASTVRQAQQTLAFGFVILVFGGTYAAHEIPSAWTAWLARTAATSGAMSLVLAAAGILLAIDLLLLGAAMARFKRSRLVLD